MIGQIWTKVHSALSQYIDREIILGFSGGPDSLCLLDAMVQTGLRVIAVHVNHQLRPEARDEARRAAQLAQSLGAIFVPQEVDVQSCASEHHLSIEEAARHLRYRALFAEAERTGAVAVVTGHTADDQVETVLMHMLRGAGLPGLKAMPSTWLPNAWSMTIPLVRPLLSVWRNEVEEYCAARDLKPVYDRSNLDQAFFRNRVRQELLPVLETYNPRIKEKLFQTSRLLADEDALLEQITASYWAKAVLEGRPGAVGIKRSEVLSAPIAVQRRMWRRAIATLRSDLRDIDYAVIERCRDFAHNGSLSRQIELVAGLILRFEEDMLWLADHLARLPAAHWPQMPGEGTLDLSIPGCVALAAGWQLQAEWLADAREDRAVIHANPDQFVAYIQLSEGVERLTLRARRPGERFRPLGMGGRSMKLSDLMINQKIPARARGKWPLVCMGEEIVWVPGCCISETARVSEPTERVVRLKVSQGSA